MSPVRTVVVILGLFASTLAGPVAAASPRAEFLFVGSYHMDNPGRDVVNVVADDVLGAKRQREIEAVAEQLARYRPTKVMIEAGADRQPRIDRDYAASCAGERPLRRSETEQLGFRIACAAGLPTVFAVDADDLAPGVEPASIDYTAALARTGQQPAYDAFLGEMQVWSEADQRVLASGTVREMLRHLNADPWRAENARSYHALAQFGSVDDPVGARWVRYWYGRNLAIFNSIARGTGDGDRVLVIYGAGHGNHLQQMAADSGLYRMHAADAWLSLP